MKEKKDYYKKNLELKNKYITKLCTRIIKELKILNY